RILFPDRIRFLDFTKQFAAILELGLKLSTHLGTNAVATAVNAGANRRPQIAGPSTEPAPHLAHAFFHNTFYRPPPARMEGSHRAAFYVHEDDRQAVCCQNCEQQARSSGDETVAGETQCGDLRNAMNEVGMNLAEGNQRPLAPFPNRSELPEKRGPVLFHRPLPILAGETQVQTALAVSPGKPAWPGAKAMNGPRQRRKRIGVKNLAWNFPEDFQRHRNILATFRMILRTYLPARSPRIIPRCANSGFGTQTFSGEPIHACPYCDCCFVVCAWRRSRGATEFVKRCPDRKEGQERRDSGEESGQETEPTRREGHGTHSALG